jgi:hypothetical protein
MRDDITADSLPPCIHQALRSTAIDPSSIAVSHTHSSSSSSSSSSGFAASRSAAAAAVERAGGVQGAMQSDYLGYTHGHVGESQDRESYMGKFFAALPYQQAPHSSSVWGVGGGLGGCSITCCARMYTPCCCVSFLKPDGQPPAAAPCIWLPPATMLIVSTSRWGCLACGVVLRVPCVPTARLVLDTSSV